MRYSIVLIPEPEEGGYGVIVPLLPGCFTQGETVEEALAMATEAITLHLEGMAAAGEDIPEEREAPVLATVSVEPDLPAAGAPARQRGIQEG